MYLLDTQIKGKKGKVKYLL